MLTTVAYNALNYYRDSWFGYTNSTEVEL
jgi:hypothetical protein